MISFFLTFFSIMLAAVPVFADAAITMPAIVGGLIAVSYILAVIPFIVVTLIESAFYSVYLRRKFRTTLIPSLVSNFASTVAGVPLYVFLRLGQVKHSEAVNLMSLLPGLVISIVIEYIVLRKFFQSVDQKKLEKTVALANILSYIFLAAWVISFDRGRS